MEFSEKLADFESEKRLKYLLVNVVARRARLLNEGARPEVAEREDNPLDLTRVALSELRADKLRAEPSQPAGQLVDIAGIVK